MKSPEKDEEPAMSLRRGLNNELNQAPNFEGLVLSCIEAKFCIQILIFQHFSRSTRFAILCTFGIPSGKNPGKTTQKIPTKNWKSNKSRFVEAYPGRETRPRPQRQRNTLTKRNRKSRVAARSGRGRGPRQGGEASRTCGARGAPRRSQNFG